MPRFQLLHHLPRIYNLSSFGLDAAPTKVYDYRPQPGPLYVASQKHTGHNRSAQAQINLRAERLHLIGEHSEEVVEQRVALSRSSTATSLASYRSEQLALQTPTYYSRRLLPQFPLRTHTAADTNLFESRMVGIGAAREEAEAERAQELKKKQWAALIADKRAAQDAARQKEIVDQQNNALQQAVTQQKKLGDQKRQEEADHAEATKKAVEDELASLASRQSSHRK